MTLFITSFIYSNLLLILSYKQYIVYNTKSTILLIPGIINFMLGFSFIKWIIGDCKELTIVAILFGCITFLLLTSIVISKNDLNNKIEKPEFLNKEATIKDFIVKSHKYYIYIASIEGFIIFVYSKHQLEINSQVTLINYNNDRYFV